MRTRLGITLLLALATLAWAAGAHALGTPAGTDITNQAFADYDDANGNAMPQAASNIVTTTVSQVAGVDVTPPTDALEGYNGDTVMYTVRVTNTGNGDDTIDVAYAINSGWTPSSVVIYADTNDSGGYDAGDALASDTGLLGDDEYEDFYVFVTIPDEATAADASTSVLRFTATSRYNGGVSDSGDYTTTARRATLGAVKSNDGPKNPGETVTYTIVVTNTGSAAATAVVATDTIPANTTYATGSITLDGSGKTDAADADEAQYAAGVVTVNIGTLAPAGTATITFQVTVDLATPAGTGISNTLDLAYNSGGNAKTVSSNPSTFTVGATASIDLATVGAVAKSGDPGDTVYYAFTVTNNGNADDVVDLTYVSSAGWTWTFYLDVNANGVYDSGTDTALVDSDTDGTVDTDDILQGATGNFLAVATIPAGSPDGSTDSLTVTGTSSVDTNVTDAVAYTTTVTAPDLDVTKAVAPLGAQPPNTTLTYTITVTNNGSGEATSVVVTDVEPGFTTFVPGSITLNGAPAGSFDGTTVMVNVGSLAPAATAIITFQVVID